MHTDAHARRSKFRVSVGSIPYYENFAMLGEHATPEEEATVRQALDRHDHIQRKGNYHTRKEQPLASLEQCAGGVGARECVALVDRCDQPTFTPAHQPINPHPHPHFHLHTLPFFSSPCDPHD